MADQYKATIRRGAEVLWEEPPAHIGAFSKMLLRPDNADTRLFDFRISSYQPKGFVAPHRHHIQEQIYYILEGEGLMEIDGKREVVQPWTAIFIPPGVEHAIYNTGMVDLKFVVVTTPLTIEARPSDTYGMPFASRSPSDMVDDGKAFQIIRSAGH